MEEVHEFSVTEIEFMIKILRHIQAHPKNRRTDLAKMLETSSSGTCLKNILNGLKREKCIKVKKEGNNEYLVFDEEMLRWIIEHQRKLDIFRYFFKREVKLWVMDLA